MKNAILALLVAILLVAAANLFAALGLFGAKGGAEPSDHEYKALNAIQMDRVGFLLIAKEQGWSVSEEAEEAYLQDPTLQNLAKWLGLEIAEDDTLTFPGDMNKFNLLPRTIREVEKDGGWEFVSVTGDNHYLFKRPK